MELGQKAYEAWATHWGQMGPWSSLKDDFRAAWAAVEAACVPAMPEDVAALVERLELSEAASAIKAHAAANERLTKELASCRRLYNDLYSGEFSATVSRAKQAAAKLREAVEVLKTIKLHCFPQKEDVSRAAAILAAIGETRDE